MDPHPSASTHPPNSEVRSRRGEEQVPHRALRVLLVEDDAAHAELICQNLTEANDYEIDLVTSLEEARKRLQEQTPDIVFADLRLRDGSGSDLLSPEPDESRYPVVLVTSQGSESAAVVVLKQGALDYLTKSEEMFADMPRIIDRTLGRWREIQRRREAERAQRRSEEHLRMALEAASVGTWEWDARRNRVIYQAGAEHVLGVAPGSVEGSSSDAYLQLVVSEDRARVEQLVREALSESAPRDEPYVLEHRIRRRDGEVKWVQLQGRVIRDRHNRPTRIAGTVADITARKVAEERLRESEEQLAHVNRVATLGEMVGAIAHDLNHPLYAIKNFAKACGNLIANQDDPDPDRIREWVDEISTLADHGGEIIQRLRDYVRNKPARRRDVALAEIIETAAALVRLDLGKCAAELVIDVADDLPLVYVDAVQIEQVLVNLIRNACEAIGRHEADCGVVRVSATTDPLGVKVCVADNGPGLPQDPEINIFDAFISTRHEGLGLGLAIARKLIEAHHGKLWAEDSTEGALFCFTLPAGDP